MRLTPQQFSQVQEALVDAYTLPTLRMMVKSELGEDLALITEGGNERVVVFNLVSWAERMDRVFELAQAAYRGNNSNALLQKLAMDANIWFQGLKTVPSGGKTGPIPRVSVDVFLTYSRKNAREMHVVLEGLRAAGFSVWTDEGLQPGTANWRAAIQEAIGQASVMVALLSPDSSASQWVDNEVAYALTARKRVVPILIAGESANIVPISLINAQWIDGRKNLPEVVSHMLIPVLNGRPAPPPAPPRRTANGVLRALVTGGLVGFVSYWVIILVSIVLGFCNFLERRLECNDPDMMSVVALGTAAVIGASFFLIAMWRRPRAIPGP